jgi:hypothetical protein
MSWFYFLVSRKVNRITCFHLLSNLRVRGVSPRCSLCAFVEWSTRKSYYHYGRKKLCNWLSEHVTRRPRMRRSHPHRMTHFTSSTEHLLVISRWDSSDYLSFSAWSDGAIKSRPPLLRPLCDAPLDNACLRGSITFVYSPTFQAWPPVSAECAAGATVRHPSLSLAVIGQPQTATATLPLLCLSGIAPVELSQWRKLVNKHGLPNAWQDPLVNTETAVATNVINSVYWKVCRMLRSSSQLLNTLGSGYPRATG